MEIRLLLEKYKNIGFSQKSIKEKTLRVCEEFSLFVSEKDVEIKNGEVRINVTGAPRTHFTLIKSKFEQALRDELAKDGLKITGLR